MRGSAVVPADVVEAGMMPAGFGRRMAAWLIDGVIAWALQIAVGAWLAALLMPVAEHGEAGAGAGLEVIVVVSSLLVGWLYWVGFEASGWQATPGKRLLGMAVVRTDGRQLSVGRALLRNMARVLCVLTLGTGYLLILWTRRRQGLHDLVADTVVVRRGQL